MCDCIWDSADSVFYAISGKWRTVATTATGNGKIYSSPTGATWTIQDAGAALPSGAANDLNSIVKVATNVYIVAATGTATDTSANDAFRGLFRGDFNQVGAWTDVTPAGLTGTGKNARRLVVSPNNATTVYATFGKYGSSTTPSVWRGTSMDGTPAWTDITPSGITAAQRDFREIAVLDAGSGNDTLYVTAMRPNSGGEDTGGIWRATTANGTPSWTRITNGDLTPPTQYGITDYWNGGDISATGLLVEDADTIMFTSPSGGGTDGIYRSTDASTGPTWAQVVCYNPASLTWIGAGALATAGKVAFHQTSPERTLFCYNDWEAFYSLNGGRTFVQEDDANNNMDPGELLTHPTTAGTAYVMGGVNESQNTDINLTTDWGANWTNDWGSNIATSNPVLPQGGHQGGYIDVTASKLYVATRGASATNAGVWWRPLGAGGWTNINGDSGGGAQDWSDGTTTNACWRITCVAVDEANSGTMYVSFKGGDGAPVPQYGAVYKSTNGGTNWTDITPSATYGASTAEPQNLQVHQPSGDLFMASEDRGNRAGGLYRLAYGGGAGDWVQIVADYDPHGFCFGPTWTGQVYADLTIFLAGFDNGLAKYRNGAETDMNYRLTNRRPDMLYVKYEPRWDVLYAGLRGGGLVRLVNP